MAYPYNNHELDHESLVVSSPTLDLPHTNEDASGTESADVHPRH